MTKTHMGMVRHLRIKHPYDPPKALMDCSGKFDYDYTVLPEDFEKLITKYCI